MSGGSADNSVSTVWFRVSTDHAISVLYQIWYRREQRRRDLTPDRGHLVENEMGPGTISTRWRPNSPQPPEWDLLPFLYPTK